MTREKAPLDVVSEVPAERVLVCGHVGGEPKVRSADRGTQHRAISARVSSGAKGAEPPPVHVERSDGDLPRALGEDGRRESICRLLVEREQLELRRVRVRRRAKRATPQLHRDEPDEPTGASRGEEAEVAHSEGRSPRADPPGIEERGCLRPLGQVLPLICERPEPVNDLDGEQRRRVLAQADVAVDKKPRLRRLPQLRV